jgi:hypothetical protein
VAATAFSNHSKNIKIHQRSPNVKMCTLLMVVLTLLTSPPKLKAVGNINHTLMTSDPTLLTLGICRGLRE